MSVYHFEWKLRASPERLWPHVSDTQRLNQALGLPPWEFTDRVTDRGVERDGSMNYLGLPVRWEEKPFEWVAGRELGVERLYRTGPIRRLRSQVRLRPEGGGTLLQHSLEFEARSIVWEPVARLELGVKVRGSLERVYRWIDAHLAGEERTPFPRRAIALEPNARERLKAIRPRLVVADGFGPELVDRLIDHVLSEDDRTLARMRPIALAAAWGRDRVELVRFFLRATRRGLLTMGWDVLCPACRGAQVRHERLSNVAGEVHCTSCDVRVDTRADRALELVFSVAPTIRKLEVRTHCIGGPGNTPHVVLQRRLAPKERAVVPAGLAPGTYRLRGPGVTQPAHVKAHPAADPARVAFRLGGGALEPAEVRTSSLVDLELANEDDRERLLLLERVEWHDDAVTVGRALALQEFVELFPGQVPPAALGLTVGRLGIVALATFVREAFASLDPDETAYLGRELRAAIGEIVRKNRGSLSSGAIAAPAGADVLLLAFTDPHDAVTAAAGIVARIDAFARERDVRGLRVAASVAAGPCIAFDNDGRSGLRGDACDEAAALLLMARPIDVGRAEPTRTDVLLDGRLADETAVAIARENLVVERFEAPVRGATTVVARLVPPRALAPMPAGGPKEDPTVLRFQDLELGAKLGAGGSGTVYAAKHRKDGRAFAVKVMTASKARTPARFEREIRALSRASGIPGIVPVRGHGVNGGDLWIALDLVEGTPLDRLLAQKGKLPVAQAASITARVARALDVAHGRGIVHRDVKPANVILDPRGLPWLTDFGIARILGETGEASGTWGGTLHYVPPEAFDEPPTYDGRSDVYSLGVTLFELIAGKPPFHESGGEDVIVKILSESAPDIRDVAGAKIPEEVAQVLTHALKKQPDERYRAMADLALDLERLAAGEQPLNAPFLDEGSESTTKKFRSTLLKRALQFVTRSKSGEG